LCLPKGRDKFCGKKNKKLPQFTKVAISINREGTKNTEKEKKNFRDEKKILCENLCVLCVSVVKNKKTVSINHSTCPDLPVATKNTKKTNDTDRYIYFEAFKYFIIS
jgi:hypothetical protein